MEGGRRAREGLLVGLDPETWVDRLAAWADNHGFFDVLGPNHFAAYVDGGPRLVVTFEEVADARAGSFAEPLGLTLARDLPWSSLSLCSAGRSWYRDPEVHGFFDRLIDHGFFELFQRVLFFGVGAAGYAAAAFSVAAPGAHVLAIRPQATLDPRLAGWDDRFGSARALDFDGLYGYAPDMADAATRIWVVHNPIDRCDAMHASLFHGPNATLLRAPLLPMRLREDLERMGLLEPLTVSAMDGNLDARLFARLLRARRGHLAYLRGLVAYLDARGRPGLAETVCRFATRDRPRPFFTERLDPARAGELA